MVLIPKERVPKEAKSFFEKVKANLPVIFIVFCALGLGAFLLQAFG